MYIEVWVPNGDDCNSLVYETGTISDAMKVCEALLTCRQVNKIVVYKDEEN